MSACQARKLMKITTFWNNSPDVGKSYLLENIQFILFKKKKNKNESRTQMKYLTFLYWCPLPQPPTSRLRFIINILVVYKALHIYYYVEHTTCSNSVCNMHSSIGGDDDDCGRFFFLEWSWRYCRCCCYWCFCWACNFSWLSRALYHNLGCFFHTHFLFPFITFTS